ncbi:E3 ubiquitin-protein ligase SDIR1 [Morella rubra]|uniref:RING-type E3 ubiquitin transferase n=1 Tax=Morella rubra TaxID=262757 RepID=A0A6A1WKT5_9ROSI|nr:E3 ubiquitin-protein ligase SDIR1 [Morella rubra]
MWYKPQGIVAAVGFTASRRGTRLDSSRKSNETSNRIEADRWDKDSVIATNLRFLSFMKYAVGLAEVTRDLEEEFETMSFVFRGSRADIESGFQGFIPEPPAVRIHTARSVNSNSLAFLVTAVLLLFMILNSHQISPNFLLWLVVGVFLMATSLRMYATCQQLQAQARAHAAAASGLLGHTELRLHMPPSIALAARGRLQGLRLQLALLDREFDDLDYDTLRALDSDNTSTTPSMSEEEINALPVHNYKAAGTANGSSSPMLQASSSSGTAEGRFLLMEIPGHWAGTLPHVSPTVCLINGGALTWLKETNQESIKMDGSIKGSENELTCSICLEQVHRGELVRSLPCLHQFHANCIDPWLRQQGTCPVCKLRLGSGLRESRESESDGSDMV